MAAAFKTSKSELVAIYRLEFYKKQKNWKFCTAERKKEEERRKAAKNAKSKLNQTYNIEPAPERDKDTAKTETEEVKLEKEVEERREDTEPLPTEERTDNLNEAFVDTETDDSPTSLIPDNPPTGPYSPKWSIQQWAARCQSAWNCEPTYSGPIDPNQHLVSSNLNQHLVSSNPNQHLVSSNPNQHLVPSDPRQRYYLGQGQIKANYEADMIYKTEDVPYSGTGLPQRGVEANLLDVEKLRDWEQLGSYEGCDNGWPTQTQVWTNRQEGWFEEICDIPEEAIEAIEAAEADAVDGAEWALVDRANNWLRSSSSLDKGTLPRSDSLPSVSSGSFTRGAALAPHSTAADLLAPAAGLSGAGLSGAGLSGAGLSGAGLTGAGLSGAGLTGAGLSGAGLTGAGLSGAALAAEVARHAAALEALLGEARRRDLQGSPLPMDQLYSYDEYPTRDVGSSPQLYNPSVYTHYPTPSSVYTHNPTVINDIFIAGSFRNGPDLRGQTDAGVGRGRGRKTRVIGIEMGRPYRL